MNSTTNSNNDSTSSCWTLSMAEHLATFVVRLFGCHETINMTGPNPDGYPSILCYLARCLEEWAYHDDHDDINDHNNNNSQQQQSKPEGYAEKRVETCLAGCLSSSLLLHLIGKNLLELVNLGPNNGGAVALLRIVGVIILVVIFSAIELRSLGYLRHNLVPIRS